MKNRYKPKGPCVSTFFYVMEENKNEKSAFINFWCNKVNQINVRFPSKFFWEYKRHEVKTLRREKYCHNLWNRMTVFWDGRVPLCCMDVDGDYIIGNLRNQSLEEIWNSPMLLAIKKRQKEKQFHMLPLCKHCDFS